MSKKALVTGASEGIGRVFARELSKAGFTVTCVARTETKLKALTTELGNGSRFIAADLATDAGQELISRELKAQHYDLLVNNAGVGTTGDFTQVPEDRLLAMFSLNCEALLKLTYAFLSKSQPGDAVINVSSTLAFTPMPGFGLYCATKAFVTSFSESLWFEQKKRDVFVMGLCPGITETDFQVHAGGRKEDLPKGMAQSPEEVVKAALRALQQRQKPTVFTGAKNLLFASMSRVMPRKSTVKLMGGMMPPAKV